MLLPLFSNAVRARSKRPWERRLQSTVLRRDACLPTSLRRERPVVTLRWRGTEARRRTGSNSTSPSGRFPIFWEPFAICLCEVQASVTSRNRLSRSPSDSTTRCCLRPRSIATRTARRAAFRTCRTCWGWPRSCSTTAATRTWELQRCCTTRQKTTAAAPCCTPIEQMFGPRVAKIVDGCTDSYGDEDKRKPKWYPRKLRYLRRVRHEDAETRFVSAADKLYNTRAVLRDLRQSGDSVFDRFSAPKAKVLWYYRSLVREYRAGGVTHLLKPLLDDYDRAVTELEHLSGLLAAPQPRRSSRRLKRKR